MAGRAPAGAVGDNGFEPLGEQPDHVGKGGDVEARNGRLWTRAHLMLITWETARPFSYPEAPSKLPSA
jgi:hypothetical protein